MERPERTAATAEPDDRRAVLDVRNLGAGYGKRPVVFDVSLAVREREAVTILGHNGAGKTTTLKSIFGLVTPTQGRVHFEGEEVTGLASTIRAQRGMCFVPAERFVFADLSVADNLRLGAVTATDDEIAERRLRVEGLFPIIREREAQLAGTMSGGQQRILSIGMALMAAPKLILLDEPSLGLAPAVLQQITEVLRRLVEEDGVSVLLLEQNVRTAFAVADRVYVMRSGRMILEESTEQMRARDHWWDLF